MIQTEFEFELPIGLLDDDGTLHRSGIMRLATGEDEIKPLTDPRVQSNPAYLICILLSRVITLEGIEAGKLKPPTIEKLFAVDLAFLQDLYNRINRTGKATMPAVCPKCEHAFEVETNVPGGSLATP
jgi:hypothetical protein